MSFTDSPLSKTLNLRLPLWQAPLPFSVIESTFSANISNAGAMGILRVGEMDTCVAVSGQLDKYLQVHNQPCVCFTHRLPHHLQFTPPQEDYHLRQYAEKNDFPYPLAETDHFLDLLDTVIAASPRAIGFANGIPEKDTIAFIRSQGISTFAICHSVAEALAAADFGIDILVLQGIEAGGEQCHFENILPEIRQSGLSLLQQVRQHTALPLILWSDYTHGADIVAAIISGAQGVMLDRPFVQCAVDEQVREVLQAANEYDIRQDNQYTCRPMRYFSEQKTEIAFPANINAAQREALMTAQLEKYPEQRPYPISASINQLPCELNALLSTLEQQIKELLG